MSERFRREDFELRPNGRTETETGEYFLDKHAHLNRGMGPVLLVSLLGCCSSFGDGFVGSGPVCGWDFFDQNGGSVGCCADVLLCCRVQGADQIPQFLIGFACCDGDFDDRHGISLWGCSGSDGQRAVELSAVEYEGVCFLECAHVLYFSQCDDMVAGINDVSKRAFDPDHDSIEDGQPGR